MAFGREVREMEVRTYGKGWVLLAGVLRTHEACEDGFGGDIALAASGRLVAEEHGDGVQGS